ncbi:RINT-1 family protein [Aspergillus clavatus NRRL 1]|uniref:RINT-1 family protein n=1 Tax=Aspergillus clavatus (strain ATCC 1007 / CBS 513.65 / DSM 816 / NCTC 3887 / NRRL 1 / QM 1276 / 107) TaxID=344612 RepID=A1CKL6_ASPCL|nr:RINT-1 family protein [Aspergillus clavatus NRRL 1]EAW09690.1 RINT-1 family protein [Aspergillus clavatus NRRL 1]
MAKPTFPLSSHEKTRVEDYLNDKIQVSADFESLDSLLTSLRAQHELQRKQLAEAQQALLNATKASNDHAEATRQRAEAFGEQQEDIDKRLKAVTGSDASDVAAKRFEVSMDKLRRLEISRGYVNLLREAEELSKEALGHIQSSPRLAIEPYTRLRNVVQSLQDAQPAAEGAASHLVDYVGKLATGLREQMKDNFTKRLQATLEQMKWPSKDFHLPDELKAQWAENVELLLDLQTPELKGRDITLKRHAVEPQILLPLEVMVHPLELRFKYHFSGDKPTNRLDKPEYFLSHVVDLVNKFGGFFASSLQPIFDQKAQDVGPNLEWNFYNASHAFITALLPMLRHKLATFLPSISAQPQLLSHLVHELMNFDNEIREAWNYLPDPYSMENWNGMTWEVLTKEGWFDRWLQVEKEFALARYEEIIEAPDSGHIDYEGFELSASKPTKAAIRVNDLLETITERYQPLSSFSQKLRFLIDIQITIFDQFHERLHSALEAYLAMTSTIGRTVQGADGQASVEGVAGLERLCRIFGSAEYLEKKMEDWSNDVFFVELWSELQERVKQNKDSGENVAGQMSLADVASRTSQAVARGTSSAEQGTTSDGALFDETASAYRRLRLRSETILTSNLTSSTQTALKPYARTSTWATVSTTAASAGSSLPPSADLAPTLRTLSTSISFLSRALGIAPLRRIIRQVLLSIQTNLWSNVLMRHQFSAAGASQFISDIDHLCNVVDVALGPAGQSGGSIRAMKKLSDGLLLLGLNAATPRDGASPSEGTDAEKDKQTGLWEVEKRLFTDNESAREVLAELDIETLTEAEARSVLERRVEIGS